MQNLLPVSSRPDVGKQPNRGFKRCSPNLQGLCTDVPESPGVTCAGKRGAPIPGPRASGSELGMATTMAEGWEEGPGHMGHLGRRPKPGKSKAEKMSTRGCCRGGRRTDCPEGPPDQGNHCAAVCKCRDVPQRLGPGESGGPLGPCLGLHRQGTWCWGTGCRTWRPQPWMTRLTFSVPPSCFALPGAHLSVTSHHHVFAKGGSGVLYPRTGVGPGALQDSQLTPACPAQMPSCLVRHLRLPETTW